MASWIRNILVGGSALGSWNAEVGDAFLRAFAGLSLAITKGWPMLPPPGMFVDGVEQLGFPHPLVFAWAAKLSESAGGLLLAAGLFTRPAAFFIALTMSVAAFGAMGGKGYAMQELALMYGSIALAYLFKGAGRLSADGLLRRL